MTHRIKPGTRYCFTEGGQVHTNTLPHDIIVDQQPIFLGGTFTLKNVRMSFPHLKRPSESGPFMDCGGKPADSGRLEVTGRPVVDAPKEIQERAKAIIPKGAEIRGLLIHPTTGLLTVEYYASVDPLGMGLYCIKETLEQRDAYNVHKYGPCDGIVPKAFWDTIDLLAKCRSPWTPTLHSPEDTMKSPFPAFVPPERPAAPAEPTATPDTPAVATLRALLTDRQGEVETQQRKVGYVKDDVQMCVEALAQAERDLQAAKDDLAYRETVAAAAAAEVETIKADIVKLGGTV